jgi:hypothetical protein
MYQDSSQPQDPYSGYGDVPQSSNPYGIPPSQSSQPLQQNPNGAPAQNPYGAGYGQPAQPSQPGYDGLVPGSGSQSNYSTPPTYGSLPNNQQQNYGAPYGAPAVSAPLPLGEAVRQLPNQYIKVLTRPSVLTFDQEKGKAAWDIVWVQLIILAVAFTVLSFLVTLISPESTGQSGGGSPLLSIILTPLIFFIGMGPYYLIAKAFKGEGTYLQQGYTALLFLAPLAIIVGILIFIPILGGIVFLALTVYANVLNIFSIMSVHRLTGGKATAVALIPGMVGVLLSCVLFSVIIAILASMIKH